MIKGKILCKQNILKGRNYGYKKKWKVVKCFIDLFMKTKFAVNTEHFWRSVQQLH